MKKYVTTLIFCLVFMHFDIVAQELIPLHSFQKLKKKRQEENLLGVDFHFFGTSFHWAKKKGNNRYVGGEIGLLPDAFMLFFAAGRDYTQANTPISDDRSQVEYQGANQLLFGHFFNRWRIESRMAEIDVGFRHAIYIFSKSSPDDESFGFPTFLGIYTKPAMGLKWGKIGFRLDGGYIRSPSNGWEFIMTISPMLRFNFR